MSATVQRRLVTGLSTPAQVVKNIIIIVRRKSRNGKNHENGWKKKDYRIFFVRPVRLRLDKVDIHQIYVRIFEISVSKNVCCFL